MIRIFEGKFLFEEGVYWTYATDEAEIQAEKTRKDYQVFFNDYWFFGKAQELVDSDLFEFCCYYPCFMEQDFVPDKSV